MSNSCAGDAFASGEVQVLNPSGMGPVVLVCDHASNYIPEPYAALGLDEAQLQRHIAWDPGAMPVCLDMSKRLDAPVIAGGISRLIIDCNRPLDAADLIPATSELTLIPANQKIDEAERTRRIALSHQPFHDAVDQLISARLMLGLPTVLIAVHSFNPVYRGVSRPWQIGIIHDEDERLSSPLIAALQKVDGLNVGINQPYSPADLVYYTIERHARARNLPCVMIEIRNDEIETAAEQGRWAALLSEILAELTIEPGATSNDQGQDIA